MFTLADQDNDGKISYKVTWYDMILILDGNSEYAAHAYRKIGLLREKNTRFVTALEPIKSLKQMK